MKQHNSWLVCHTLDNREFSLTALQVTFVTWGCKMVEAQRQDHETSQPPQADVKMIAAFRRLRRFHAWVKDAAAGC